MSRVTTEAAAGRPSGASTRGYVTLLLVAMVLSVVTVACSDDQREADDDPRVTTSRPETEVDDGSLGGTPPPLTALERSIVDAFATTGMEGKQAELPGPSSASMWASGEDGEVYVFAEANRGTSAPSIEGAPVLEERLIAGVPVRIVESGGPAYLFACEGTHYLVRFERQSGHGEFLERFIPALGCPPQ